MKPIIYFDNAATTWPKPECVINAVTDTMRNYGGNPGRGVHRLARAADELLYEARLSSAKMFHAEPENIVFTMNATHALNIAVKGLAYRGCHILIDNFAHNASYRPAAAMKSRGCTAETYDASGSTDEAIASIESKLRRDTGLLIATHRSNICSKTLDIEMIGRICKERNIPFVVDASQSAGTVPIDFKKLGASAVCMPGHKGLYGPMGSGILICDPETEFSTLIEGGAGFHSKETAMPAELPERLEAGTVALPAVAGLKAGIDWVMKIGIENIARHEKMLSETLIKNIRKNPGIRLIGPCGGAVVSMLTENHTPAEAAEILNNYGICVRSGLHCAPLAHKTLGTDENGTLRVSFSYHNRISEVNILTDVLNSLIC